MVQIHKFQENIFYYLYKVYKENLIKQVADYYEHIIDRELYKAMYEYEIEIDD